MILLESDSSVIKEALKADKNIRLNSSTKAKHPLSDVDIHFTDHSYAHFHLSWVKERESIRLSLKMPAWSDIVRLGLAESVAKEYGGFWRGDVEEGYDVSVEIVASEITEAAIELLSTLRQKILAAPLLMAIECQKKGVAEERGKCFHLSLGDKEAFAVAPVTDHIVVVFSTTFPDATDIVLARVFLQEFYDIRKQQELQDTPAVLFGKEPPADVAHLFPKSSGNLNYISFVLFERHFSNPEQIHKLAATLPTFRDYLHYHLKCSKAYLHKRMRAKTADFLKILNRAKPESF
jgi:actin related protein 2/3 complex subunit 2